MAIKHAFVSSKADGVDTSLVKPSDWNAEHSSDEINLIPKASSTGAEGTVFYCSADNYLYVAVE